jgi:hypothetical protein
LSQFIFEASLGKKVWYSTATAHFYTRNGIGRIAKKQTRESSILFNFRSLASLGKKNWHSTATVHFYTRNGIGRIAQKETRESSILFNFRSLTTVKKIIPVRFTQQIFGSIVNLGIECNS